MDTLSLSTRYVDQILSHAQLDSVNSLADAHSSLQTKTCRGSDFLGWIDLPETMTDEKISEIIDYSKTLRNTSDVLIVCGIGGSYLGSRAILEALSDTSMTKDCEILFLGNHLSGREYERVFTQCKGKRVSACVISKSGTTMETAISYRLVREFLLSQYSLDEVRERIVAITDEKHGALRAEADKQGYKTYILPSDVGGRYSVMSPVGLLPCAVAGIDIRKLIEGARKARGDIVNNLEHPAFLYAQKRVMLEQYGFVAELFITAEPSLYFIGEWWKQLMGESHGKEGKGLYPDTLTYTADLHSLGQYVQEGRRLFFETLLWIRDASSQIRVPAMDDIPDGLHPLVGRSLHEINLIALESTAKAHNDGGCPSMILTLDNLSPEMIGYFMYTMMYACALSGIMIGINPFDQPGVEAYKDEMRQRLK